MGLPSQQPEPQQQRAFEPAVIVLERPAAAEPESPSSLLTPSQWQLVAVFAGTVVAGLIGGKRVIQRRRSA